jgi:hypothetical protein
MNTTITISKENRDRLERQRLYKRESCNEILGRVLDECELKN